jgi:hypothetical protein
MSSPDEFTRRGSALRRTTRAIRARSDVAISDSSLLDEDVAEMTLDEELMKSDEAVVRRRRLLPGGVAESHFNPRQVRTHRHDNRFRVTAGRLNGESRRLGAYAHTARLLTSAVSLPRAAVVC